MEGTPGGGNWAIVGGAGGTWVVVGILDGGIGGPVTVGGPVVGDGKTVVAGETPDGVARLEEDELCCFGRDVGGSIGPSGFTDSPSHLGTGTGSIGMAAGLMDRSVSMLRRVSD